MKWLILSAVLLASAARADDNAALAGAGAQQAYHAMAELVAKRPADSVVLASDAPLLDGRFVPCGAKPLGIIVALDAAVRGDFLVPGAAHAIGDARKAGVAVFFTTDRSQADAAAIAATLTKLKLGPATPGETLLTADARGGDARRADIAAKYCVIAVAGTRLADFTDRFAEAPSAEARRTLAVRSRAGGKWGKGWFLVPAPSDAR